MLEEQELFQIRITEEGKRYIKKFASLSFVILGLIIITNGFSIYWGIKTLVTRANRTGGYVGLSLSLYQRIFPYIFILSGLFSLISHTYYIRFPRVMLRGLEINDESGANKAFGILYKGARNFLVWLLVGAAMVIWSNFQ